MDGDLGDFGARLLQPRIERGLTREELVERVGAGNGRGIWRYERGGRDPRLSTVLRLAAALEIAPARLVGDE